MLRSVENSVANQIYATHFLRKFCVGIATISVWWSSVLLLTSFVVAMACGVCCAEEWNLEPVQGSQAKLVSVREAASTSTIHLQSPADVQAFRLRLPQQTSLVHGDFRCAVRLRSNQSDIRLGLEVVLPQQIDPRTQQATILILPGSILRTTEFEELQVEGTLKMLEQAVKKLRSAIRLEDINSQDAYIRAIVLSGEVHLGDTYLEVQSIRYGPVVAVDSLPLAEASARSKPSRLLIARDQITIDGRPSLLTFVPDHGEPIELFLRLGVDAVWTPDLSNHTRLQRLADAGLLVMATPPHPEFDPANFSVPLQGLPPLHETYAIPDLWYLGTSIEQSQLNHLLAWAREVRSADRELRRPLMADVRSAEGVASRQIDFVGISHNIRSGMKPFGLQRNRSYLRKNQSAQLVLPWEWIHTQYPDSYRAWYRRTSNVIPLPEPEQILMQTIAAISAGSKGIGFWKDSEFATSDRQEELLIAIELSNIYLHILEPILISGQVQSHIRIGVENQPQKSSRFNTLLNGRLQSTIQYDTAPKPDAALIDYSGSTLVVAANWDEHSHVVPGPMRLPNSELTVAANETASAWMVSATGMKGLRRQTTAGGLNLNLPTVDMFAFALITSDVSLRNELQRRIFQSADRAAELFLKLAKLKLLRVGAALPVLNVGPRDAFVRQRLRQAETQHSQAEIAYGQKNYAVTESNARACLANLRQIQEIAWAHAGGQVERINSAPELTSFDALVHGPFSQASSTELQLNTGGDFESLRDVSEFGWQPVSTTDGFQTAVNVVTELGGRNQALRLRCWARETKSTIAAEKPPLLVLSPTLDVKRGDVIAMRGRIRLGHIVNSVTDQPFLIFDSDFGPEAAMKPKLTHTWQQFQMIRRISDDRPVRLWMGLSEPAEVYLDDLQITKIGTTSTTIQQVSDSKPQ